MKRKGLSILLASLCLVIILCTLPFINACGKPTQTGKTLQIGLIYSLTGEGSEVEIIMKDAALLARDWINNKGGITVGGEKYQIELVIEDSKASVDGTVAAATKLVTQSKVKFIAGQTRPDLCMTSATVTEPAKVIRALAYGGGMSATMNPDLPYTFCPVMAGGQYIPTLYDYMVETNPQVKTVALIDPDEPGGIYYASLSEDAVKAHGLTVAVKEMYPQFTQDYYPVLTKVLAAKPDALDAGAGFPNQMVTILKQVRELGFTGPVWTFTPCDLYPVLNAVGKEFSTNFFNVSVDLEGNDVPSMIKEIQKQWEAKYTGPFVLDAVNGWDSLWCLVQAIEEAQSFDPSQVAASWEKIDKIETSFGTGHMGGLKTYGINHLVVRKLPICTLDNGAVKFGKWYSPDFP
jgi:branched-chain amino acid transport system substrate-binding protein